MELKIKAFSDLSTRELYEILRLRSEVFIVEQKGCYQDLDGIDYDSLHLFFEDETGAVAGCVRIFPKPEEPGPVQVGRLVCRDRGTGMGRRLMEEAERMARARWGARQLYLTGRKSAEGFYLKCGYFIESDEISYDRFRKKLS